MLKHSSIRFSIDFLCLSFILSLCLHTMHFEYENFSTIFSTFGSALTTLWNLVQLSKAVQGVAKLCKVELLKISHVEGAGRCRLLTMMIPLRKKRHAFFLLWKSIWFTQPFCSYYYCSTWTRCLMITRLVLWSCAYIFEAHIYGMPW